MGFSEIQLLGVAVAAIVVAATAAFVLSSKKSKGLSLSPPTSPSLPSPCLPASLLSPYLPTYPPLSPIQF